MNLESGAGLLHVLTSYTPGREWDVPHHDPRVRQDLITNDPETVPPQVKTYADDLPRIALPRDIVDPGVAASAVLAGVTVPDRPLDLAGLGRVLFLGAGVVRVAERRGRRMLFRAAGSAGNRFPMEIYVSTHGVAGVPDGVHWYDPVGHELLQIAPAAGGEATTLVVTGVPWRTGWRYAERGFRHIYWDSGTALSQFMAAASSGGLQPRLRTLFPDAQVTALVGADGTDEFPVALLSFGDGTPAIIPGGPAATGELPHEVIPLCTEAQRAGDRDTLGEPWPSGDQLDDVPDSPTVDEVIRHRGSQRLMDRTKSLPRADMEWAMRAALRGIDLPHWLAVHGVDGVAPGIYRWPDLDNPIATGDLREELGRVCLGQLLGADAAYVAISGVPFGSIDDRGYRDAQLAAGIVEGRLHLAAYAFDASASGMTFLDSEVPALLGADDDLVTLLFTCVGVPEYRSRPGGRPGEPATFRMITPRLTD